MSALAKDKETKSQSSKAQTVQAKAETKAESKPATLDVRSKLFLSVIDRVISFEQDNPELGKTAVQIATFLLVKGEALPEDKIASKLNLDASEVRKILQLLSKYSLIESIREAIDPERGRYESRWRVSRELVTRVLADRLKQVVEILRTCLQEYAATAYYVCPVCFRRYSMDEAYNIDFKCPRDDTPLVQPDITAEIEFLTNLIRQIQEYIEKLISELKHR